MTATVPWHVLAMLNAPKCGGGHPIHVAGVIVWQWCCSAMLTASVSRDGQLVSHPVLPCGTPSAVFSHEHFCSPVCSSFSFCSTQFRISRLAVKMPSQALSMSPASTASSLLPPAPTTAHPRSVLEAKPFAVACFLIFSLSSPLLRL